MPLPSKEQSLAIKMEMRPRNIMPQGETPGCLLFGEKPEYDPGEFVVYEWHDLEQKTKAMITDLFGVQRRLEPVLAKMRYPTIAMRSALDRLTNFRRIVVNKETGEVFTRSVGDYDQIRIFGDGI